MRILNKFEIVDLGLVYKDNLIIGDLQLGYEDYLREKGTLLPKFQFKDIMNRLENILKKVDVKRVIFNGDIKHEFGRINRQEWDEILYLFDFILDKKLELVLVKGNHDPILFPLAKKRGIEVIDKWDDNEVSILHGDKILLDLKENVVIAHEHPAISFREKPSEKFKCFLVGKFGKSNLIVMPSFTTLNPGTDISKGKFISPFLNNLSEFSCYLIDDDGEARDFGKIRNLPT